MQGLAHYRFDLPQGDYEIELIFAELEGPNHKENLVYDLEQREKVREQKSIERVFDVQIGGQTVATALNVLDEVGPSRVLRRKSPLQVKDETNLVISFIPKKGETILNAIRLRRVVNIQSIKE